MRSYQAKRLQPIKATDLKNAGVASPLTQLGRKHTNSNNADVEMVLMQPSPSHSVLTSDLQKAQAIYQSTDLGSGPSMLTRNSTSKRAYTQEKSGGSLRQFSGTKRPLPKIDHSKQLQKLKSITAS